MLSSIYGLKFREQYQNDHGAKEAMLVWAGILMTYDQQIVDLAFGKLSTDRTDPWPPTLPEFVAIINANNPGKRIPAQREYKAIPKPEECDQAGLARIAELRALAAKLREERGSFLCDSDPETFDAKVKAHNRLVHGFSVEAQRAARSRV
jgi:hypothetical protein